MDNSIVTLCLVSFSGGCNYMCMPLGRTCDEVIGLCTERQKREGRSRRNVDIFLFCDFAVFILLTELSKFILFL